MGKSKTKYMPCTAAIRAIVAYMVWGAPRGRLPLAIGQLRSVMSIASNAVRGSAGDT
jgi:hypothetical protein